MCVGRLANVLVGEMVRRRRRMHRRVFGLDFGILAIGVTRDSLAWKVYSHDIRGIYGGRNGIIHQPRVWNAVRPRDFSCFVASFQMTC